MHAARSCCSMGICWISAPFQSWKQNPRGTLFVVSAMVPNPSFPEPQTHLIQMVALFGRCIKLSSASIIFLALKGSLLLSSPVPRGLASTDHASYHSPSLQMSFPQSPSYTNHSRITGFGGSRNSIHLGHHITMKRPDRAMST